MSSHLSIDRVTSEIRDLYQSGAANPEPRIESYLTEITENFSQEERSVLGRGLVQAFKKRSAAEAVDSESTDPASHPLEMMVTLLFGKRLEEMDLPAEDLVRRLADSLNIVFDSLNELIGAINTTFMGQSEGETIRMVISSDMVGKEKDNSLQSYLDQIKESLGIMNQAYRKAAFTKMKEMLDELDPKNLSQALGAGIKIGPFKKAELFSIYESRYQTLRNWLDSGLLIEALIQEFEKSCQKLYFQKKDL
jgi:hypothetical protein